MEEYLLQGPPAYKRPRLDSIPSASFLDARANMVPYGFFSAQEREADLNMATMTMSGSSLLQNSAQDFGPLSVPDWRCSITNDTRNNYISKLSQLLLNSGRSGGENLDLRMKRSNAAINIEKKIFKTATSRSQYFNMMKDEIHKLEIGYGISALSSQFFPSSSTTSAAAANNLQLVNMQNYGPNGFGDSVSATQSHSQPGIAHSATSVNLFSENSVGGSMRIPVTSSIGSARTQYDAFNGGRPIGPRSLVRDQVPSSSLPLGDPSQFMPNSDQVIAPSLLHSISPLMTQPLNHFLPSSTVSSQQRFGSVNDSSQGVLSENVSLINSQMGGQSSPKEWHKSLTFITRNTIIRKMGQMLAAIPDPQPGNSDSRMRHCLEIATEVESETHRIANSQSQYYDMMVSRCQYIAKDRANMSQAGLQYYQKHMQDLRWTYENLGITYPNSSSYSGSRGSGGNGGGGINMRHDAAQSSVQPPQSSIIPNLMGSSGHPVGLPPPYPFARGQVIPMQQPGHNQLMERLLQVPLSAEMSEVPDVVKQLAHAYKCQERENQENDVMMLCSLPNCRETKNLLNHITTCQIGITCCGSTKEIIEHWNRCSLSECPICLPVRQAERNLNSIPVTSTSINNQMSANFMGRRVHRSINSSYPSTATSGLLSNQSQASSGPNSINLGRNEQRIRSSMWHSSYNDTWQRPPGVNPLPDISNPAETNRRFQRWSYNRNNGNRNDSRRQSHGSYGQWPAMEMFFPDNVRSNPSIRGSNYIGPMISNRSIDRLQPYGAPWRAPEILFAENVRPAHRHVPDSDEPVVIPPEDEQPPDNCQTMKAIVKVIKTQGGRLEQKYRCSRRGCNDLKNCLHRRLAASNQSPQTPIPG